MAYSTQDNIEKRLTTAELVALTDDTGGGLVDTAKVIKAITDADELINSYLAKLYAVPVSPVPGVVAKVSAEEAIYNLYGLRRKVNSYWETRHKENLEWLARVAKGEVVLDDTPPASSSSSTGAPTYETAKRIFTRDEMKDL